MNSRLVRCSASKTGVVKVQNGDECKFTLDEEKAVSTFLLSNATFDDTEEVADEDEAKEVQWFIIEGRQEAQERAAQEKNVGVKVNTSRLSNFLHL